MPNSLENIIAAIDSANAKDPNIESDAEGNPIAKELLYSQRMTSWLEKFAPDASDHLHIAARGQHIERWTSPRDAYPEGRSGYKKWRAELGLFHANRVAELMANCGYSEEDMARVKYLVQKRGLKRDPESQTLEDVICLVFIEHYLAPFSEKHPTEKLIDIIQKTWAKMSQEGHKAALTIPLSADLQQLVAKALQEP